MLTHLSYLRARAVHPAHCAARFLNRLRRTIFLVDGETIWEPSTKSTRKEINSPLRPRAIGCPHRQDHYVEDPSGLGVRGRLRVTLPPASIAPLPARREPARQRFRIRE